ncbi:MAG: response regulator transcription factor [Anaerolineae bacterium]
MNILLVDDHVLFREGVASLLDSQPDMTVLGEAATAREALDKAFEYGGASLTFERDVQPFFTEESMWFDGSQACAGCHFGNTENSYHEMDLTTYAGIMAGGDVLSEPPGVPILGQSEVGATDYNWSESKLRARLRNNRMAPGVEFDITEENRDDPLVLHGSKK